MAITFTWIGSPSLTTSSTRPTYLSSNSLMWHRPSRPGRISMNAPKSLIDVTLPSYTLPTRTSSVSASTLRLAASAPAASMCEM